jgi:Zn ribbon nucleic-acid-binding protein
MNMETKTCQNCQAGFAIEPEDFDYYKKLQVPPPTFCPECRLQRRLAFLNISHLYHRQCDLCHAEIISVYRADLPYKVYCQTCWWSDKWDPLDYGRDYDFNRPFFEQFKELWQSVPLLGLSVDTTNVNSPYINLAGHVKNSYLIFHADFDEDALYGYYLINNKNVVDCSLTIQSEYCYDSMHTFKCNGCVGLRSQVTESLNCAFLKDCDNCQDCFGSANLKNKKYYIFNQPYSREEYFEEMKKWDLGSHAQYQEAKRHAEECWATVPPRPTFMDFSVNCTGNNIFESKNVKDSFEVISAQDCRFLMMMYAGPVKDCYDVTSWGNNAMLCYEGCNVGENASQLRFCQEGGLEALDCEYAKLGYGGRHQFGCVSMRKTPYCILNKAYSESEYKALRERIIEQMNTLPFVDAVGTTYSYGEFFPMELSPFPYNITLANDFFPLAENAAVERGLAWRADEPPKHPITISSAELPDHIKDVDEKILQEVIGCARCNKGFKIAPAELQFLKGRNFPLPRECPFCRIEEKVHVWAARRKVAERVCERCGKAFASCYSSVDVPKILCKECWLDQLA